MIISRLAAATGGLALAASAFVLTGCTGSPAPGGDSGSIGPVVMTANELQGATVELSLSGHKTLDIDTESLDPASYSLGGFDPDGIVVFTPGGERDGATFNPGIEAEAVGTTVVTLTNSDGGIQDLEFTVNVTE